ncbi:hypothetical protein PENTCL1PPCAC_10592, partial [Pristionchus entomophagus]
SVCPMRGSSRIGQCFLSPSQKSSLSLQVYFEREWHLLALFVWHRGSHSKHQSKPQRKCKSSQFTIHKLAKKTTTPRVGPINRLSYLNSSVFEEEQR